MSQKAVRRNFLLRSYLAHTRFSYESDAAALEQVKAGRKVVRDEWDRLIRDGVAEDEIELMLPPRIFSLPDRMAH